MQTAFWRRAGRRVFPHPFCVLRSGPHSQWISKNTWFSDRPRSSSVEEGNVPTDLIVRCQIGAAWRKDARAAFEKLGHNGLAGRGQILRVSHSFDAAPGGLYAFQARRPR
jgi:hypothetical protein